MQPKSFFFTFNFFFEAHRKMVTTQHPSLIDLPHRRFITNPLSYQERDSYRESCFLGKLFGKF